MENLFTKNFSRNMTSCSFSGKVYKKFPFFQRSDTSLPSKMYSNRRNNEEIGRPMTTLSSNSHPPSSTPRGTETCPPPTYSQATGLRDSWYDSTLQTSCYVIVDSSLMASIHRVVIFINLLMRQMPIKI